MFLGLELTRAEEDAAVTAVQRFFEEACQAYAPDGSGRKRVKHGTFVPRPRPTLEVPGVMNGGTMTFREAVSKVLRQKYATFSGRAGRAEFWWFFLFQVLFLGTLIVAPLLLIPIAPFPEGAAQLATMLLTFAVLGLFLPSTAVAVRRLHDTGLSGWWYVLLFLFPSIFLSSQGGWFLAALGNAVLVVLWAQPSARDNRYGPGVASSPSAAAGGAPPRDW
jgi:uncharacterized membrane protein YhaH (DUF805 family)